MNWNIFKKISKENPKFWEHYVAHFDDSKSGKKYIAFDCETTGLDTKNDRILSIGAIAISDNKIEVANVLNIYVQQDVFKAESVPIHGILKEGNIEKIVEAEAVIQFLDFIKNATLIGHNVAFDIEMINKALDRLDLGKLKNNYMDTDIMNQKLRHFPEDEHSSLDELCDYYKIKKSDRHTAAGDAYITALLFLKLKKKLAL